MQHNVSSSSLSSSDSALYPSQSGLGAEDWGQLGLYNNVVGAGAALGWFQSPDKFLDCFSLLHIQAGMVLQQSEFRIYLLKMVSWNVKFFLQDHIHILKRKCLAIFSRF